jgi:hypothetical protein
MIGRRSLVPRTRQPHCDAAIAVVAGSVWMCSITAHRGLQYLLEQAVPAPQPGHAGGPAPGFPTAGLPAGRLPFPGLQNVTVARAQ